MPNLLETAVKLVENGYAITPIRERTKAPLIQNWVENPIVDILEAETRWKSHDYNIGVICGRPLDDGTTCVAIDVDVNAEWFIDAVARAIGHDVPAKKGDKGITYFVRYAHPFNTTRRKNAKYMVEMLGAKTQTVVPPSIHPSGKQYEWAGKSLLDVPIDELPKIDEWVIDEINSLFNGKSNAKIAALNTMTWRGVGNGGDTHDTCVAAVAAMVSRNWPDDAIFERINRAKKEACERNADRYDWPEAHKTIMGWINSAREKGYTGSTKKKQREVAPDEFVQQFILVRDTNQLVQLDTYEAFGSEKFNSLYLKDYDNPWVAVLRNNTVRTVRSFTYKPQQPGDVVVKEENPDTGEIEECFNLYKPPTILPHKGNVKLFTDHIRLIFPEQYVAEHILHWLAFLVQHPGEKIMHALLIQGEQGIGKTFIAHAMGRVLGRHNVGIVDHSETASNYTGWMRGKQLVAIEEVIGQRRKEFMNHLKALITADRIRINEKYTPVYEIPNRTNLMLLTNYKYSLLLDPDDRRFFVAYSPISRDDLPQGYFDRLYDWVYTNEGAAALMQHLGDKEEYQVDGEDFNVNKAPPMTQAKIDTIEMSRPDVEQYLMDQFHAGGWPMACDLISINHVFFAIQGRFRGAYLNQVQQAIATLGGKKLSSRKLVKGERVTLYAMRNHDTYEKMATKEIERIYNRPLPARQDDTEGLYEKSLKENRAVGAVSDGDEY